MITHPVDFTNPVPNPAQNSMHYQRSALQTGYSINVQPQEVTSIGNAERRELHPGRCMAASLTRRTGPRSDGHRPSATCLLHAQTLLTCAVYPCFLRYTWGGVGVDSTSHRPVQQTDVGNMHHTRLPSASQLKQESAGCSLGSMETNGRGGATSIESRPGHMAVNQASGSATRAALSLG
jgi:hypothetical protein